MRKTTCDRCGDEFPHVIDCPMCEGSGDFTAPTEEVYEGQCSKCKGSGKWHNPFEGKGFKMVLEYEGRNLHLNVTVSEFHDDRPDFCDNCLPIIVREALQG